MTYKNGLIIVGDNFWYRAICMNNFTDSEDNNGYLIYFLDWGIEYSVNVEDVRKMSKEFVYLPATAHKCNIQGNDIVGYFREKQNSIEYRFNFFFLNKSISKDFIIIFDLNKNIENV